MDETKARIQYRSTIEKQGEPDTLRETKIETEGTIQMKGNAWYVRFQEEAEGLEGSQVIWKLGTDSALLLRSGQVQMRQEFREGTERNGKYQTPFGNIDLLVYTDRYRRQVEENLRRGVMELTYQMEMLGETNTIKLWLFVAW